MNKEPAPLPRPIIRFEDGRWWATSPLMPGWVGVDDTYDGVYDLAEEAYRFLVIEHGGE